MHPTATRRRDRAPARLLVPVLGALTGLLLVLLGPGAATAATTPSAPSPPVGAVTGPATPARGATVLSGPAATAAGRSPAARPDHRAPDRALRPAVRPARGWRALATGAPRPAAGPVAAPRGPTHVAPDHHGPVPMAAPVTLVLLHHRALPAPVVAALPHPHPAPRHAPAQGRAPPR